MLKNKDKKTSSSQQLEDKNIQSDILYAEAVEKVEDDSFYNAFQFILISLFTLCLIYAIVDIASKIFAQ